MTLERFVLLPLAVLVLTAGVGCSTIPPGGDPALDPALRRSAPGGTPGGSLLGRLVVAPIGSVSLSSVEAAKGWKLGETSALDRESLRAGLVRSLAASGRWDAVRAGSEDALHEAWRAHDDWVLTLAIENVETHFEGRNGWWIPNIVNFFLNTPFAWFVATEDYTLTFDATLTIASGDCGRVVVSRRIAQSTRASFDEFDRGWQLLGPITSSLDAEGWRGIAEKLLPGARREVTVRATLEAADQLTHALESPAIQESLRKTLVLAIGVTDYEDPRALPPLPHARGDAERVASEFLALGALPQHIVTLTDSGRRPPRLPRR